MRCRRLAALRERTLNNSMTQMGNQKGNQMGNQKDNQKGNQRGNLLSCGRSDEGSSRARSRNVSTGASGIEACATRDNNKDNNQPCNGASYRPIQYFRLELATPACSIAVWNAETLKRWGSSVSTLRADGKSSHCSRSGASATSEEHRHMLLFRSSDSATVTCYLQQEWRQRHHDSEGDSQEQSITIDQQEVPHERRQRRREGTCPERQQPLGKIHLRQQPKAL